MTTRTGKIARLPKAVREELNQRLEDGAAGPAVLDWLNGLPAVKEVLAKEFAGVPVSKQNLGAWREGGYTEWVTGQEVAQMVGKLAEQAGDLAAAGGGKLAEHLGVVIAARYAMTLGKWNGEVTPEFESQIGVLRRLSQDITRLRRCEFDRDRVEIKRARDAFDRERTMNELCLLFEQWLEHPNFGDILDLKKISLEERMRRFGRIFKLYMPKLGETESYGEQEGPPIGRVTDPGQGEAGSNGGNIQQSTPNAEHPMAARSGKGAGSEGGAPVAGGVAAPEDGRAPQAAGQGESRSLRDGHQGEACQGESSQVKPAGCEARGAGHEGEAGGKDEGRKMKDESGGQTGSNGGNSQQPVGETVAGEAKLAEQCSALRSEVVETEEERRLRLEKEEAERQRLLWEQQNAERLAKWELNQYLVAPVVKVHHKPTGDIMGPCDPPLWLNWKKSAI